MEILSLDSTFKKGKYANKSVADLVGIKGQIFSMIKEGYVFDDEVLKAAHITKVIRDKKVYCRVGCLEPLKDTRMLLVETASMKQILSELNTLEAVGDDVDDRDDSSNDGDYENDIDLITIDNFEDQDE